MDSKDLIKLARIFDNFIELDSSRVRIKDIVAVQKADDGVSIVTPYGVFSDSIDYEMFNTRIKDTLELIKENDRRSEIVQEALRNPVSATPQPIGVAEVGQSERKIIPLDTTPGKRELRTTINVGTQGAQGNLFSDETLQIIDRQDMVVLDPTGQTVLAKPGEGSAMKGENVSGFIYTSGKYMLSFLDYPHKSAIVSYSVKKKAVL